MAAFNDSRLIWSAISLMIPMIPFMSRELCMMFFMPSLMAESERSPDAP